jgi:hypothetical protein
VSERAYNPLDKINLGKSVAEALLDRPSDSLGEIDPFNGAGIYAVYYTGTFPAYRKMGERNRKKLVWPMYVGKAIPSGGRKGAAIFSEITGRHLWSRLREHAESIRATPATLNIGDFQCRSLIVDDIWIPLGETLLISRFKPVWNVALDGFGNHDPGSGRYEGFRPLWDVLHPGRSWAEKCRVRAETGGMLSQKVEEFLKENEPPPDARITFSPPTKA